MRRIAPLLALAVLSAFTAEFLLGDQYLSPAGFGQQVAMVILYTAFYGAAAVLIREVARRLGLGWPSILLMAFGFGVFEEGVITQSLFNPHYLGLDLLRPGFLPLLGIGLPWTVFVLSLHVIWSMSAPIALFESIFTSAPRLRRVGFVVVTVIFVLGAAATFAISLTLSPTPFIASPFQLGGAVLITVLAFVVAVRLRRAGSGAASGRSTSPWAVWAGVLVGLAATTAFELSRGLTGVPDWVPTVAMLVSLTAGAVLAGVFRFSPAALAGGAVLTYAWVGLRAALAPHLTGDLVEQTIIVAAYLALLVLVVRRTTRRRSAVAVPRH